MEIAEIWRYPVKTMGGEPLARARIGPLGIEGDRVVHVEDARQRVITSRSHPRFLAHRGTLGPDGEPLVERFDVLPLLVATDGAIAAFGHDRRRLRPNLVIGGVDGMAEREWPGCALRVGKVLIGIRNLRQRCIMTSFDPDTQVQDRDITRGIYQRFGGDLALDCHVIEGGDVAVGDAVELLRGMAGDGLTSS